MASTAGPGHLVAMTLYPGVDALDVTGPAEVFAMASEVIGAGRAGYDVRYLGARLGPVATFSGVRLCVEQTFDDWRGTIDTLVVPGKMVIGPNGPRPAVDQEVVAWLSAAGPSAGRVASVCAGTHITAAAGLLDGHRATTHWATADLLAAEHPSIEVDADPIFVRSGRMWSSAGLTASMDLALALVAEDHGEQVALEVARIMVMYLRRPGGQSQFSVPLAHRGSDRVQLRDLRVWIGENLGADLSVPALAARVSMSERHFARVFHAETGSTPGAFVEQMRLEEARRLLERTDRTPRDIASGCGFGSLETLHRVFRDRLATTPGHYRSRFHTHMTG
jgi:transcriptional regulator GlxA family with amidase domain